MSKAKTLIEQLIETADEKKLFAEEMLITECTELICKLMKEKNITRAQLAKKLGKTKGYITQLLNGNANMTLRTIADVFYVLGAEVEFTLKETLTNQNVNLTYHTESKPAITYRIPKSGCEINELSQYRIAS